MRQDQFAESAIRIKALYSGVGEGYISEVYQIYKDVEYKLWNTAIDRMAREREDKFKPTIPEYRRWLALARKDSGQTESTFKCLRCDSYGMVPNSFMLGERVVDAVSPCPQCNATAEPKRNDAFKRAYSHAIRLTQEVAEQPTPATVKFIRDNWDTDEPIPDEPHEALAAFSKQWCAGKARSKKAKGAFGKILAGLKPKETTSDKP